jgi:hypothetical protein
LHRNPRPTGAGGIAMTKRLRALVSVVVVCGVLPAAADVPKVVPLERRSGYVAFDADGVVGRRAPKVEVTLDEAPLGMALAALRESGPLPEVRLYSARLRVFDGITEARAPERVAALIDRLVAAGWSPVLRLPDARAALLLRTKADRIRGLVLLAAPGGQVVFGNLVGDADPEALGQAAGRWMTEGKGREWLAQTLGGMAAPAEPESTGSVLPARALGPDGFTARLEAESMTSVRAEVLALPAASGGEAVWFDDPGSSLRGTLRLEAGAYEARVVLQPGGLDRDAVFVSVLGRAPQRVFRAVPGLGPVGQRVLFRLDETADVAVEVHAAEMGLAVDRVDFVRLGRLAGEGVAAP